MQQKQKFSHSGSANRKCYNCHEAQVVVARVLLFQLKDPSLPTCRSLVKRICVNFALLCLPDINIKRLKESQFMAESGSLEERLLSLAMRAIAISCG